MEICFGVDYYPEHWPRQRWETDARLMREMGIDVVRMGEFAWSGLEPEKGKFQFDWLEDAIDLLAGFGIKSILGTPSAAPPAWMIAETPEIQPVGQDGLPRYYGGRHHDCQSNHIYREHIRRYVTAFSERFGNNPNVIGWQIDNELGNSHHELCFCDSCAVRFRQWLQARYGDIETLNQRWGTAFWSQGYQSLLALRHYKEIAARRPGVRGCYEGVPETRLREVFGVLYPVIEEENNPDLLAEIDIQRLESRLPEIYTLINALPDPDILEEDMLRAGCSVTPNQIGLADNLVPISLAFSPFIRRRLTFMRLLLIVK